MKVISRLLVVLVATFVLLPTASVSAIQDANGGPLSRDAEAKACSKIGTVSQNLQSALADKRQKAEAKRLDKKDTNGDKRQKLVDNLASHRNQADAKRQANFEKLRAVAKTDQEKQAVETYVSSITSAVNARRGAYDAATTTYYNGLKAALSKQQADSNAQAEALKNDINNAVAKAQASCQDGTSVKDAITTLKSDLQNAQSSYKQSRKSNDIRPAIKQLNTTRKESIKSATDTFINTAKQAREQLISAFGTNAVNLER